MSLAQVSIRSALVLLLLSMGEAKAQTGPPSVQVLGLNPSWAAPGTKVSLKVDVFGLRTDELRVEIDGQDAPVGDLEIGSEGTYTLTVQVPEGLSSRGRVPVEVIMVAPGGGSDLKFRALQRLWVAEPLSILAAEPPIAVPGERITIRIPERPLEQAKGLSIAFDGAVAEMEGASPGALVAVVPKQGFEARSTFRFPFHRAWKPKLEVYSDQERSKPFLGLEVKAPLLDAWQITLTALALLVLLLSALARPYLERITDRLSWIFAGWWKSARRLRAEPLARSEENLPAPQLPEGLVEAFIQKECVVYVGAGLSTASGYPGWPSLVGEMLEWAIEKRHVSREFGESLRAALREGDADLVADSVVGGLRGREEVLHRFLADLFDRNEPLSRAHRLLREIPFCAALTTNFDELLEHTFEKKGAVYTPADTEPLREDLANRRFFLLKLYGSLRKPSTLVVSSAQYQEAIAGNRTFTQAMEGLFFSRTILFVGASLQGIEAYLGGLAFRGHARRTHYALLHVTGTAWRARADLLNRRYGIEVIPYHPSTPAHPEVVDFLSQLRERVASGIKEVQRRSGPEVLSDRAQPLTRVRLENVGPFNELDIELNPRWTVLLGDNGVGKTTVLEAVAAATCGEDAEPWAGRLIRNTARTARIVLSAGHREYLATLTAREGGHAQVEVTPSRPLETEGWLAIGFPPLRTVTWGKSKGPGPEGKRRPTSEDLLPLLRGGVDSRLDELKQWLVNLDYWSKSEAGSENRYSRLRDQFFEMVKVLTEGVQIRFKGVDEFTHQVTVETDDGEVPIEALSQGTASLMGWTGFLLQRLHEVYGSQEGDPGDQYAVVLADEIDAHMHPAWQQAIVERLSNVFKGAQFIASTHSPFIVSSLPSSSVIRFRRSNSRVVAERLPTSFEGWRVDQILTSPLFDLSTGRGLQTQRVLLRYTELAARSKLNEKEQQEIAAAAEVLNVRMPTPAEREEARKAFELLENVMEERLQSMSVEEQEKILAEAKVQLQEAITGSRRPK